MRETIQFELPNHSPRTMPTMSLQLIRGKTVADAPWAEQNIMKQRIKVVFVALVLSMSLPLRLVAGPFEDGMDAYMGTDYSTVFQLLGPLADQGDARSQYVLGSMFENGRGVPLDYAEALKWHRMASDQGYAPSMVSLAFMFEMGLGVPQNYVEAYKLFSLAITRFTVTENGARDISIKSRDSLASQMTAAQIAEAQRLTREWKRSK